MIIYFTGTGNSRCLANILAEQLKDECVDATQLIRQKSEPTFNSEKPFVFVAPTYAWRMPRLFDAWIRRCAFIGNQKAYFVLNCGSEIGNAASYARKLCMQMNFEYMGTAEIIMPENYIVMFSTPSEEEIPAILSSARAKAEALSGDIRQEKPLDAVPVSLVGYLMSGIVNDGFYGTCLSAKKFYATDACVSCGRCAEYCMLLNIKMVSGKPVWGKDCTHCMACICHCPTEAIEYGRHTKGLRRYTCPDEK